MIVKISSGFRIKMILILIFLFSLKSLSQEKQILKSYYVKTTFKILDEKGNTAVEKKFADLTDREIKTLDNVFNEEIESLSKRELYSRQQIDKKIKDGGPNVVEIDIYKIKRAAGTVNGVYINSFLTVKPMPSDGLEILYASLRNSFKVPETPDGVLLKGKIYVNFIIREDGSLTDFRVLRDLGYGTGQELIRVLKLSKKWIPGEIHGEIVAADYTLPFTISELN
ncbi:hypothetical protein IRZ71_01450 [Flavobacterium sp. ANB]|uniref:energy transducer TonB n=1 Tax=unclassified Flavobacterium TaxID=196869 RepID=UPI0012B8FC93|nr:MULTISPECIES: hypothetical protein [unclassified Flavobacterium]MBF4514988.1 hypothetical protein [Flavobacterium sp. ANB]MTD68314.1 hypothetical protein [Flavobacterium sp. LC2016-13]